MSDFLHHNDAVSGHEDGETRRLGLFALHMLLTIVVLCLAVFGSIGGLVALDTGTGMAVIVTISLILHGLHLALRTAITHTNHDNSSG